MTVAVSSCVCVCKVSDFRFYSHIDLWPGRGKGQQGWVGKEVSLQLFFETCF